jgi:hypothetical protein
MEKSGFIQDINGIWIWDPMTSEQESCEWTGPSRFGYASGFGTLVWYGQGRPVATYIGNMRHGKCHGKGVYNFACGDKYDGEWQDGLRHGYGVFIANDGSVSKGRWEKDIRRSGLSVLSR